MARDPFAPVTQSTVPPWIWIVGGTFALLLIAMGATVLVVVSKRAVPPAVAAPAAPAAAEKASPPTATASAAPVAAPDKEPDKVEDNKDDKPHKGRRHRGGGKGDAVASKPAGSPAASSPAPKKKSDMSQKEIDNLLGL